MNVANVDDELYPSDSRHILLKIRDRFDTDHEPMILVGADEFTDAEIRAYNDLHVIPFNPVADTLCEEGINEWGGSWSTSEWPRTY